MPQELRWAGITMLAGANQFLQDLYREEFNFKFTVKAAERGTAFSWLCRRDLDRVFTIQTERIVDNDNTVAIKDR